MAVISDVILIPSNSICQDAVQDEDDAQAHIQVRQMLLQRALGHHKANTVRPPPPPTLIQRAKAARPGSGTGCYGAGLIVSISAGFVAGPCPGVEWWNARFCYWQTEQQVDSRGQGGEA